MGVYHFMGLGLSVGTVTAPVSYLATRYQRWNEEDRTFFSASGERAQRDRGGRVGDIQSLVLITTEEVFLGDQKQFLSYPYFDNRAGVSPKADAKPEGARPMRKALSELLPKEWERIAKDREAVSLYWCIVDRTDLLGTFERVSEALLAAKAPGALGKEVWVNLTGGNNVINLALQLSATLTGQPARFYYIQAANRTEESCIRYPRETGYWVDLPLLPISPNEASRALVEIVAESGEMDVGELLQVARALPEHFSHFIQVQNTDSLKRQFLQPLGQQGLLEREGDRVRVGRAWRLLQPYYQTLDTLGEPHEHLGQLAERREWFHEEELPISKHRKGM